MTTNDLHITIGIHPTGNIDLQQDIKLVKAALLYADKVKIYSPTLSTLQLVMQLGGLSQNEQLHFFEMVVPYLMPSSQARPIKAMLKKLRNIRALQVREIQAIRANLFSQSANVWDELKNVIVNMAETAGMQEIATALNSGTLEIHQFSSQADNLHMMRFVADCVARASGKQLPMYEQKAIKNRNDQVSKEFVEGVLNAVSSGATYPLFDTSTGYLVQSYQQVKPIIFTDASQNRARHIALANDLFQRLPVFDLASTYDVLLIRGELDKYLVRFRSSIVGFASSVASSPWDVDFDKDVELIFRKEIAPVVLDLEEEIKSNKFLAQLARKFVDKPLLMAPGTALSLALSQITNLPHEIAIGLGASVNAAAIIYDTYNDWRNKQKEIERNGLYFYYRAGKKFDELA